MIRVPGIRAVIELLRYNSAQVKEIWIAKDRTVSRLEEILNICDREMVPVHYKNYKEISLLLPGISHQGVVAIVPGFRYYSLKELISLIKEIEDKKLILALDHITDEGNFASIIRTSAFFGVHGIIIPKNRSVSVSSQVIKRSSGAYLYVPIIRVVNLAQALEKLNKEGFWIIGTSHKGNISLYQFDWDRDLVLVLGNEYKGISYAIEKTCDEIVNIPLFGAIDALNVGVAAGVFLSEITRTRKLMYKN